MKLMRKIARKILFKNKKSSIVSTTHNKKINTYKKNFFLFKNQLIIKGKIDFSNFKKLKVFLVTAS